VISLLASAGYCAAPRFANLIPSAIWRGFVIVAVSLAVPPSQVLAAAQPITIHADVATAREGGQVLEAQGHVVLGDGRTTLRADYALYRRREGHIQLNGHVHIATAQGDLSGDRATSQLGRKGQIEAIEATGGVIVRSADRTVRADRVTYQTKDQTLTAIGHVVVTFPPDLRITGATLVASGAEVAVLTGHPRIEHPAGVLEGDRVDVAVQSQIAFVRGNVQGVFSETKITSALATLFVKDKKAIFRDHVTVDRPGRTMTAEVVTYYYAERRLVAEGPTTIKIRQTPP
jgi:lipopolysaccharide export system protein LptA